MLKKKKDLLLIAALRQDARLSLSKISKKVKMPISTIHDRLKVYEEGLISKHTALIDFAKLGYGARANVLLKVKKDQREELQKHLEKSKNINSFFKVNNGYDFLIELVFRQIKDLEDYLEELENRFSIKSKETYFVIEDIKKEAFLSNPQLLRLTEDVEE